MNAFNPYREWLGLDATITTPNYYQLFGIDEFESDQTKISHAADKAISKVRSCKPGSYALQWSNLLDELNAAKQKLSDVEQKDSYDALLRDAFNSGTATASEPKMHVEGVAHADPSVTRDFFPPSMQAPAQPIPMPTQDTPAAATPAVPNAQAPYQPGGGAPTSIPQQPVPNAQQPYQPTPTAAPTSAAQQPYQPAAPVATPVPPTGPAPAQSGAVAQPYTPPGQTPPAHLANPTLSSPFAAPYVPTPQPTQAPVAMATPGPTAPVAPTPTAAPVAAAVATPAPVPTVANPTTAPVATTATAVPVANTPTGTPTPRVGSSPSVANQQRSRGKSAAIALPFVAVGIASVLLIGGLIYMGMSKPKGDDDQNTQVANRPVDRVIEPEPISPIQPTIRPPTVDPLVPNVDPDKPIEQPSIETPEPNPIDPPMEVEDPPMVSPNPTEPEPTDPEPTEPEPTEPEPTEPEPTMPEPTEPEPTDMPDVPPPTQAELVQLGKLLTDAREALSKKEFDFADTQIAKAEGIAKLQEHRAKVRRLKQLGNYTKQYWDVVNEALGEYEGGEELPYRDSVIIIVEKSSSQLTIRYKGINKAYPLSDLPAGIAMAIADQWFDETEPSNLVFKGAWGLVMPNASDAEREKARGWWDEAIAKGVDISDFIQVIDDTYDFADDESSS